MKLAVVADPVFLKHFTPGGHPERAERLAVLLALMDSFQDPRVARLAAQPADWSWIGSVHSALHLEKLRASAGRPLTQFDPDTWAGPESLETALCAAGSCIQLVEKVVSGEFDSAFAMVRPPGHHAERDRAMGFCLINNIAVAAERALALPGVRRVAIFDYDVHHGNGTQEIFENRGDVLYLSVHQHPLYPGTGAFRESGVGEGRGCTVNFPAPPGMGNHFYAAMMDELVTPILIQYEPDLVLASAGFDAHHADPLASMDLDTQGYRYIASRLNSVAARVCGGKIVYVLEGGYDLNALEHSVMATLQTTLDNDFPDQLRDESDTGRDWRRRAREVHGQHWGLSGRSAP